MGPTGRRPKSHSRLGHGRRSRRVTHGPGPRARPDEQSASSWSDAHQCPTQGDVPRWRRIREVPGRARRPRRCRGVDGAQPAGAAAGARCWPACWSRPAADGLTLSGFDYEVSTRVDRRGRRRWSRAASWCPAGCSPTSPAACRPGRSRSRPRAPKVQLVCGSARFTLLTLPVEDYPTLPEMPTLTGTLPGARLAAAVAQVAVAAGRDDTLPVLTGIRIEIDGDTVTLAATDRYRLAVRELAWIAGAEPASSRSPWCRRARWPTRPSRSAALRVGRRRAGAGRASARAWSASRAAAAAPPPGCSTASSRSTARCCPTESATRRRRRHRRAGRGGQARRAGRRAQHPGAADLLRRRARSSTPAPATRRRRPRRSSARSTGETIDHRVQPAVPARRSRCRRLRRRPAVVHDARRKPAVLTGGSRRRRRTAAGGAYRYLLMPVRLSG